MISIALMASPLICTFKPELLTQNIDNKAFMVCHSMPEAMEETKDDLMNSSALYEMTWNQPERVKGPKSLVNAFDVLRVYQKNTT